MRSYNAIFFLEDNLASFKVLRETIGLYGCEKVLVVLIKASYGQNYSRIRQFITDTEQADGYSLNVEYLNLTTEIVNLSKQLFPGSSEPTHSHIVTSAIVDSCLHIISKKHSCDNIIRALTPLDKILNTSLDISVKSEHIMSHQMIMIEGDVCPISTNLLASCKKDINSQFEDVLGDAGIQSLTLHEVESAYLNMGNLGVQHINLLEANLGKYRKMSDRELQIVIRIQEIINEKR